MPNHAVAIVGWDDDYPAANFDNKTHTKPPANGAWLVKNSWCAGTNDFPNAGMGNWGIPVTDDEGNVVLDEDGKPIGSGYFWLSYYDRSISTPEALIFDELVTMTRNSPYDASTLHRDQYDLMPASGTEVKLLDEQTKSANVLMSENGEHLMTISYEVAYPNTEVSYEVYLLADARQRLEERGVVELEEPAERAERLQERQAALHRRPDAAHPGRARAAAFRRGCCRHSPAQIAGLMSQLHEGC